MFQVQPLHEVCLRAARQDIHRTARRSDKTFAIAGDEHGYSRWFVDRPFCLQPNNKPSRKQLNIQLSAKLLSIMHVM
jgi:hypothetical protein